MCIKTCPGLKCVNHKCVTNSQIRDSYPKEEIAKQVTHTVEKSASKPPATCKMPMVIKEGQYCAMK